MVAPLPAALNVTFIQWLFNNGVAVAIAFFLLIRIEGAVTDLKSALVTQQLESARTAAPLISKIESTYTLGLETNTIVKQIQADTARR